MKKTTKLRNLIYSPKTEFIIEAHNGLSAKIVEEAGFKGIWGSGLTLSASLGVRDNNEVSWTQVLDILEFMSDATTIPILLDGDTGYGNFNNMIRLVNKLEQRDIAGVCIEDKIFPKTNSFINSEKQPLAEINEFCGRIKAGKDTQKDSDFCIVARVEAFIAGWGIEEALKRAYSYSEAGADAILIHSKISTSSEIVNFMKHWDNSKPIVIVPTMYYKTPTEKLEQTGVSLIIWANHILRSSIKAMQETSKQIYEECALMNVEKSIVPVSEVFRLQNVEEFKNTEKKYLPNVENIKAVILAASKGDNFGPLTDDKPKCMIRINNKTILETQIETLNNCKLNDITAIVGYENEMIDIPNLKCIKNPYFDKRSILYSYYLASKNISGHCIFTFGDILFEEHILQDLINSKGDIVLAVDTSWWQGKKENREIDLVIGEKPPSDNYLSDRYTNLKNIGVELDMNSVHGEWTGLMKLTSWGTEFLSTELEKFYNEDKESFFKTDINSFLLRLIEKKINIKIVYFRGHWLDIDSVDDLTFVKDITH